MGSHSAGGATGSELAIRELAGEGSNLQPPDPKSGVLPIELPAKGRKQSGYLAAGWTRQLTCGPDMGSLIKKRRKRMRKKKHKKMLKATRWQRRAGK
jgi:Mitochondrial domain of unknown function (DUF1713)